MLNNNNNSIIYMTPLQHIPYLEIFLLPEIAAGRQRPPTQATFLFDDIISSNR